MTEMIKHLYMMFLLKKKKKALNYWDCIENSRLYGDTIKDMAQEIVDELIEEIETQY